MIIGDGRGPYYLHFQSFFLLVLSSDSLDEISLLGTSLVVALFK